MDWKRKLTSRKFWISVAALLASIYTLINGMYTDSETLSCVGLICGVVSSGIYAFAESNADSAHIIESEEADG